MATTTTMMMVTAVVVMMMMGVGMVRGHGMVIDPPQRSSMWRFGYKDSPTNYNDNQLFCGGFSRQWSHNGGKCGICGDPYDAAVKENEAGGKFATGVIVKTYPRGQVIDVAVKITANHLGYFVFKLCPNNDVKKEATQECLDQHVLKFVGPSGEDLGTKFYIDSKVNVKYLKLQLPNDVTCQQCVLQWTYNTGNSWGCDKEPNARCCIGCGAQENFVNCADIAITGSGSGSGSGYIIGQPQVTFTAKPPVVTDAPQTVRPSTSAPVTQKPISVVDSGKNCHAGGVFTNSPNMDVWCQANCQSNFCPAAYCTCD